LDEAGGISFVSRQRQRRAAGVGNMIKWIKERDPKVQFGLIENKSGEAIVDISALAGSER